MIVVDTSVVVKWAVPEQDTDEALALIDEEMTAPDLLVAELGHVLTRKVRRLEIGAEIARAAVAEIPQLILLVELRALDRRAFELSLALKHSIYDCYFLALAEITEAPLVTADAVFAGKLRSGPASKLVRLLGEG